MRPLTGRMLILLCTATAIFAAVMVVAPWWGYIPGILGLLVFLGSLGAWNAGADRTGLSKWGDDTRSGGGGDC